MGDESEHPAKKVTDAQLKAALQNICNQSGQPVARAKDIADHESIDVGSSAVNERLPPMVENGELAKGERLTPMSYRGTSLTGGAQTQQAPLVTRSW